MKKIKTSLFIICVSLPLFALASRTWSDPKLLQWLMSEETQKEIEKNSAEPIEATAEEKTLAIVEADDVIDAEMTEFTGGSGEPWQAPDYTNQTGALGWSPEAFAVPPGLRGRVDFWKKIYTKYDTSEGILHDSLHIGLIYTHIDFRQIPNYKSMSEKLKRKARRALVSEKKKEYTERIERLAKNKINADDPEDLRLLKIFEQFDEDNKFKKAIGRKRMRFQLGQKDRFKQGIYYSGRYLKQMEKIFADAGMPKEITRLPFVESSFNVKARSHVGASGIWQFMRYTGRKFVRINYAVDERNDPLRATQAAAKLMRLNYQMLGKWPLAITGYNHGPAGVQRVIKKFNTDDIVELVDERNGRFGFASANFYASFLAALEVEKEADKHFGPVIRDFASDATEIKLDKRVSKKQLVEWFEGDVEKAKNYNLHIQRPFWLGYTSLAAKDFIRVPAAKNMIVAQNLQALKSVTPASEPDGHMEHYMIGHGETLSEISVQLGVSVRALMEINGIDNPRRIRAGQKLLIPSKK